MTFSSQGYFINSSVEMELLPNEDLFAHNEIEIPFGDSDITSNKEEDYVLPDLVLLDSDWIFLTANVTTMLLSVISNVFVIYFICGQKRARSAQNISIVSVAVADIFIACFVVPTHIVIHTLHAERYSDDLSPFLCKLHTYTWYWCKTVTVYSMSALICDRYSRVVQPSKSHILSGRYMFFLSFVWFFGAAYNVWEIVLKISDYVNVTSPENRNYTVRTCVTAEQFRYIQHWLIAGDMLVIYTLPFVVAVYMYGVISFYNCRSGNVKHRMTNKRRLFMSICLFTLFLLCQLPLEIINAFGFVTRRISFEFIIAKKIAEVLSLSQGTLNIVVYSAFSPEVHAVVKNQLGKAKGRYYSRVNSLQSGGGDLCAMNGLSCPRIEVHKIGTDNTPDVSVELTVMSIQKAEHRGTNK